MVLRKPIEEERRFRKSDTMQFGAKVESMLKKKSGKDAVPIAREKLIGKGQDYQQVVGVGCWIGLNMCFSSTRWCQSHL